MTDGDRDGLADCGHPIVQGHTVTRHGDVWCSDQCLQAALWEDVPF